MLRYDKRTYAYKTLDPQKTTVKEEVIDDGVAAVKLLRARPEVAHDRIFVVGHSLGAMLAPDVASKARPVAGIVMLAPGGRKLPAVVVQQMRYLGQGVARATRRTRAPGRRNLGAQDAARAIFFRRARLVLL